MTVLITGAAGFIGSALALHLLGRGENVVGIDNHNDYYDPSLKEGRLARHSSHKNYTHLRIDIADRKSLSEVFIKYKPKRVVNLAAQAGVRYSIENPASFVDSNLVGFFNVLEGCRNNGVEHLVYASSSSVYGANTKMPFSEHQNADHPLSLYAATKKSNELMAHSYSHLYNLPVTGLRFFTVYGPWGRPDMALFKFTKAIFSGEKIQVFNYGDHLRDFTYIDDVVEGVIRVLDKPALSNAKWNGDDPDSATSKAPWRVYNIGNNSPVKLMNLIRAVESTSGKFANIEFLPMQLGDVTDTFADVTDLAMAFNYRPNTIIENGVANFIDWYRKYYKLK